MSTMPYCCKGHTIRIRVLMHTPPQAGTGSDSEFLNVEIGVIEFIIAPEFAHAALTYLTLLKQTQQSMANELLSQARVTTVIPF